MINGFPLNLRHVIPKDTSLGNIILDDQSRSICGARIAAVDLQEVGAEVVVVILGETQAELGESA